MLFEVFESHGAPNHAARDDVQLLHNLVAAIRPARPSDIAAASQAIQALCFICQQYPTYHAQLRDSLLRLLDTRNAISLYSDQGIQSDQSFFAELYRRITYKWLPAVPDPRYLKDVFGQIFTHRDDHLWVNGVADTVWIDLIKVLAFAEGDTQHRQNAITELSSAIQVLSYRLSASGLDPELILQHEDLENTDSPFITQNIVLLRFLNVTTPDANDFVQVNQALEQCSALTRHIRSTHASTGTSIALTALMQRILQQLARMQLLLSMLQGLKLQTGCAPEVVNLLKQLVTAECRKHNLSDYWQENTELLALRITENASHTGEHYIASERSGYFKLMRSAMGAGVIIALMALLKLTIASQHLPPLTEAILFSLNYGLGFVLIHLLHFTVATKQPAMTAATIAASIDGQGHNKHSVTRLVNIVAQTTSSQTIAILGNVMVVIPVALSIDWLIVQRTGHHFVSTEKALSLLSGNHPWLSLSVLYAAVAGVCLFLSGLIAGYHDNLAAYNRIPERLAHLPWLKRLLGEQRLYRVSEYIRHNLGALAGNFYFGCLLGFASGLGVMLGLPLDIRHVTFVAAFFGYASAALDFSLAPMLVFASIMGIITVALVNLFTSFGLALYVAMKSRKVRFAYWRLFAMQLLRTLCKHPGQFLLPPR